MNVDTAIVEPEPTSVSRVVHVRIPRWINERCPPLNDILSAHDVARLTRRPRWWLTALCVVGRFPKKQHFRGRKIGWCRAEVLGWMARELSVEAENYERLSASCRCTRQHSRQACLPLECAARSNREQTRPPCATRRPSGARGARSQKEP